MTSHAPPAGWYADPSGAPGHRWWDGQAWSAHTAPALPQPSAPMPPAGATPGSVAAYGHAAQQHRAYPVATSSPNRYAFMTFAVVALYVIIALETRFVIFGFLPLGLSLRSKRSREPLAPVAIAAAAIAILAALVRFAG